MSILKNCCFKEPLFIDAMGLWCSTEPTTNISTLFKYPEPSPQYRNNYNNYFNDSTSILSMEQKPLLSLDEYNIYMEQVFPAERPVTCRFSVTNTSKTDLSLTWNSGNI